jgi:hypothetical protein
MRAGRVGPRRRQQQQQQGNKKEGPRFCARALVATAQAEGRRQHAERDWHAGGYGSRIVRRHRDQVRADLLDCPRGGWVIEKGPLG